MNNNNDMSQPTLRPLMLVLSQAALAMAALPALAQTVPNSGQIIQQVPQPAPVTPQRPGLTIQQPATAPAASSAPFMVQTIQITGNTVFDNATLHALVADGEGKTITLGQLDALSARITKYYRDRGYPLTRAIIPAQTLTGGTVRLQVLETRYGSVKLDNSSKVSTAQLSSTLGALQSGQLLSQASLDRALLLLSDYPGVSANATLSPGAEVGSSDLGVRTSPGNAPIGNVYVDTAGSRYTGRLRLGANLDVNNPLGRGDVISLTGLTSTAGLDYLRGAYQLPVNGQGTRVGIAFSGLRYSLQDSLAALGAHGNANVTTLWGSHPIIRSIDRNLYARVAFDHKEFEDHIDATSLESRRGTDAVTFDLSADQRDTMLGGGLSTASIGITAGRLKFRNAAAEAADAATANSRGNYAKLTGSASRLQALAPAASLYLGVSGQWTNDNLDASEQLVLGGPGSVRGYGVGSISGGSGVLVTGELRYRVPSAASYGVWQAVAFVDAGRVKVNANQWVAGQNSATLSGAGVGINWTGTDGWSAKLDLAAPIGSTPALLGTRDSSWAWIQLGRSF